MGGASGSALVANNIHLALLPLMFGLVLFLAAGFYRLLSRLRCSWLLTRLLYLLALTVILAGAIGSRCVGGTLLVLLMILSFFLVVRSMPGWSRSGPHLPPQDCAVLTLCFGLLLTLRAGSEALRSYVGLMDVSYGVPEVFAPTMAGLLLLAGCIFTRTLLSEGRRPRRFFRFDRTGVVDQKWG